MAGPRALVDGPTFAALPYGLWDVVQKPTPPDDSHWQNGVTWQDRCATGDTLYDECIAVTGVGGSPTAQAAMTPNVTQTNRGATSFTVYAEFDCAAVGLNDAATVAAESLAKVEQFQVERAFWTGVAGKTASGGVPQTTVFPHLAANATVLDPADSRITLQSAATVAVTGSGDDTAWMLGQLEANVAACYHGQAVIHVPTVALPSLAAAMCIRVGEGGQLYTPRGNLIAVGDGYPGTGPDGQAAPAGSTWIYATGAMFGYRSNVFMPPAAPDSFDRIENTYRLIAQRTYVIGFECCLMAARVTLGVPT